MLMNEEALALARPAANAVRDVFGAQDAELIEPPAVQPLAPYIDLSGEDVRARIFAVEAPDGARLCLRPDMTIPVCLHHITVTGGAPRPACYRVDGQVFRYAKDPALGPGEFTQLGLERFGDVDPLAADVDMCVAALEAVKAGGGRITQLMIGDAYLFPAFFEAMDLDDEQAARLIRRTRSGDRTIAQQEPSALAMALAHVPAEKMGDALSELFAIAGVEPVGRRPIEAVGARLAEQARAHQDTLAFTDAARHARALMAVSDAPRPALDAIWTLCRDAGVDLDDRLQAWARRFDALEEIGVSEKTILSVAFARQFDYYDAMVFEVRDEGLGLARVMAAGGRYDRLFERLGGSGPLSGVGVMARPLRIAQSSLAADAS